MPKPPLREPFKTLETQMIESFIAGLHQWRGDLNYPESHSDMQAGVRGILQSFDVERLPIGRPESDIVEESPKCEICNKRAFLRVGGTSFCGNDHAREFARNLLNSAIGSNGERGVSE